jgi:hypothetical protein
MTFKKFHLKHVIITTISPLNGWDNTTPYAAQFYAPYWLWVVINYVNACHSDYLLDTLARSTSWRDLSLRADTYFRGLTGREEVKVLERIQHVISGVLTPGVLTPGCI